MNSSMFDTQVRGVVFVSCIVIFISLLAMTGLGTVAGQEKLDVSVDIPEETVVGDSTEVSASVTTPDRRTVFESEMTIRFYSDGDQIESETVSIRDGETETVEISHEFEESGERDIRVEASVTFGGLEFTGSSRPRSLLVQKLIDGDLELKSFDTPTSPEVDEQTTVSVVPDIPTVNSDTGNAQFRLYIDDQQVATKQSDLSSVESPVEFPATFTTAGETTLKIEAELSVRDQTITTVREQTINVVLPPTEVEGVSFTVPESLSDEVRDYRETVPQKLDANAFVLATPEELYVVFTQKTPKTGEASVEGVAAEQNLQTENITFGTIAATNVSFNTTGEEIGVQEISENADQYRLEVVRVSAQYRRASSLTDPDQGSDFTASTTSGVLLANSQSAVSLVSNVGSDTRSLSRDASTEQANTVLTDPRGPHLRTASLRTKFWTDSEATVDAVVLSPQTAAQQFVEEYDRSGIASTNTDRPILYVFEEDFGAQDFSDVASIKSQSESLDGQVVETEARMHMEQISVQETLEHNTPCENRMQIQTPQGPSCVNVPQDNLLHAGVAWNDIPQSRDDGILLVGVSSHHQDSPSEFVEGRYRITGEIVSSSRFDESLPESSVLVIHEMDRLGSIDYGAVRSEAKSLIESRTDDLTTQLRGQIGEEGIVIVTDSSSRTVEVAAPENPATAEFTQSQREPVTLRQANVSVSSEVRDLQIRRSNIASLPADVSQPPDESLELLNISTSAADESVTSASLRIRVSSAAVSSEAMLTVYRYHENEWTSLGADVVEETDDSILLRVETPGFSYFAVGSQSDSGPTGQQTDQSDSGDGSSSDSSAGDEASGTVARDSDSVDEDTPSQGEDTDGFTVVLLLTSLLIFVGWQTRY